MSRINKIGVPRLIIICFFMLLWILAAVKNLQVSILISNSLVRIGMNLIMVLAMVPAIRCGIGLNFALPIGIICGLLGSTCAIEFHETLNMSSGQAFLFAIIIAVPLAILLGWLYGKMLNKIKGSEMLVSTYVGFSIVSLFCIAWIVLPFKSGLMRWPIGQGLRTVVSLEGTFDKVLDSIWDFNIGAIHVPTGLLLFCAIICLIYWIFSHTRTGIALKTVGDNPKFAQSSGLNVDRYRILGTILSTVLGAIGMIAYAQSFGYLQLYAAPLMMAFPAVAAVLIGGASANKVNISYVILGTILFQGLLTIALPVASSFFEAGNISEVIRMIVQNGIILYALAQGGKLYE